MSVHHYSNLSFCFIKQSILLKFNGIFVNDFYGCDGHLKLRCQFIKIKILLRWFFNICFFSSHWVIRMVMCVCVVAYFIMMGVLTWYTTYLERGIFCTALNKDVAGIDPDDVWNASSSLKR